MRRREGTGRRRHKPERKEIIGAGTGPSAKEIALSAQGGERSHWDKGLRGFCMGLREGIPT